MGNTAASNWDSKLRKKPLVFRLFFSFGLNLSCLPLSLFRAPPNQEYERRGRRNDTSSSSRIHHSLKIARNSNDADSNTSNEEPLVPTSNSSFYPLFRHFHPTSSSSTETNKREKTEKASHPSKVSQSPVKLEGKD